MLKTAVTWGLFLVILGAIGIAFWTRPKPEEESRAPPAPVPVDHNEKAVAGFIDAMRNAKTWGESMTRAQVSPYNPDTLIITMTPAFELQSKRLRLVFAKTLANAWEHIDARRGAKPSIRLEDGRGQRIGGSTWLGDVEVDDD